MHASGDSEMPRFCYVFEKAFLFTTKYKIQHSIIFPINAIILSTVFNVLIVCECEYKKKKNIDYMFGKCGLGFVTKFILHNSRLPRWLVKRRTV